MDFMRSLRSVTVSLLGTVAALLLGASSAAAAPGDEPALHAGNARLNAPDAMVALRARAELGALGVLAHHIRYGDTTRVNYRDDADQDTLFFFARLSTELQLAQRHTLVFLYQPLQLRTEVALARDLKVGEVEFTRGTPTRFGYGFDFYRIAYQYDLFPDARRELSLGGGFQIRNARVSFVSADGERGFTQTNLGFVPLLRVRGRYVFDNALFLESELDGWISPVPTEGRAGTNALGAIADLSLRAGAVVTHWSEVFLTLRYLGGGFRGESSETQPLTGGDKYSSNWLHTMTFSVGAGLR